MQSLGELLTREFPPEPFLIDEGIMRLQSILVIGGAPKAYKSFLQNSLVLALVTGRPLFGAHRKSHGREEMAFNVAKPCRVLMLEQELGDYDLRERFLPMFGSLGPAEQDLLKANLFTHSMDYKMQLDRKEGIQLIDQMCSQVKPDVVILDPLIEFHTSNENDTQAMSQVMRGVDMLRQEHKACFSISHHEGKPNEGNGRTGPDKLRGNSVIYGKGDTFLMAKVVNRPAGLIRIDPVIRRGKPISPFYVTIDWSDLRAKFHSWHTRDTAKQMQKFGTNPYSDYEV